MPMATRRSSNADKATDGTPASTDELMVRIGALERVLMSKLDTVVGELRAELVNTVQLLEGNFNKLQTRNDELNEEMKQVKTELSNNTIKITELEQKLQDVQGHSIANEQYSRKKNVRIFGLGEDAGENCTASF